ncbi:MAG: bifunctional nicotinamidase/pyrazinamidase [Spirochaetaceae bacterium]|nr:bifunctional nicotinamidase/pyrazinamidase [Spirochaetaceae bacterium]
MRLDVGRSALLIVDVQNDFCPGGALGVPDGDAVVGPINRISRRFRFVAATQDWHPADHVSFAASWPGRRPQDRVESNGVEQILWPEHCVQGSAGAAFHPGLALEPVGLILRKGFHRALDSYSALFENDRRTPTGLDGWLRSLGVERLFLTGLATDYCVRYTALDAIKLGYRVAIVEDAVRGVDLPRGQVASVLGELRGLGVEFRRAAELED